MLSLLFTVYAGTKSFYKEEDETKPVNVYGRTKVDAEKLIRANWPNYAILRSSIIYGPQPAFPVPKTLPIQVRIEAATVAMSGISWFYRYWKYLSCLPLDDFFLGY
jgi:nucleoside-diphosphate-sugar epimerase